MSGGLGCDLGHQLLPLASPGFAEVAGERVAGGSQCCGSRCLPLVSGAEDQRTLLLLQLCWETPFLLLFCSALAHLLFLTPLPLPLSAAQLSITCLPDYQGWSTGLGSAHCRLPGVGRCILQHPAAVGSLPRVGCTTSHPPRGWVCGRGRCGWDPREPRWQPHGAAGSCCHLEPPGWSSQGRSAGGSPAGPPALPWPPAGSHCAGCPPSARRCGRWG